MSKDFSSVPESDVARNGNVYFSAVDTDVRSEQRYLLLMFQGKRGRVCSFNHGRALQGEHGGIDSAL